jgi:hypothetical protein
LFQDHEAEPFSWLGNTTVNVEPTSGSLWTSILPPLALVVKSGSKISAMFSGGMPAPVSWTAIATVFFCLLAEMVIHFANPSTAKQARPNRRVHWMISLIS